MFNPVIIKGNKQGIRLVIDEAATVDDVISSINKKLINTKHYYSNIKPISVSFDGKKLTEDETQIILNTLRKIGLNIASPPREYYENTIEKEDKLPCDKEGLFYIGNLKNGQEIIAYTSIVIIGDVEVGASVLSYGSIIVIGRLDGYAKAGIEGKQDAFVYSF